MLCWSHDPTLGLRPTFVRKKPFTSFFHFVSFLFVPLQFLSDFYFWFRIRFWIWFWIQFSNPIFQSDFWIQFSNQIFECDFESKCCFPFRQSYFILVIQCRSSVRIYSDFYFIYINAYLIWRAGIIELLSYLHVEEIDFLSSTYRRLYILWT